MQVVAVHQPNFLPWLGFFEKFDRADVFVLLDEVQLARRSATTRVSILLDGRSHLLSLPVRHTGSQSVRICDAELDTESPLLRKGAASLERAYSRCPHWSPIGAEALEVLADPPASLLELNLRLLTIMATGLGVDAGKIRLQSSLGGTGQKSELMASLTRAAGGDVYLSGGQDPALGGGPGPSGADYNDPAIYTEHGVALVYQNFEHPSYEQGTPEFVPGLTALDALTRVGPGIMAAVRDENATARTALRASGAGATVVQDS